MRPASPQRGAAIVKADQAWRGRTLIACGLFAGGVLALGAVNLDWTEGPAMALGQLAGMVAPIGVLGGLVWAAARWAGRRS